jgi:hypothetical protein
VERVQGTKRKKRLKRLPIKQSRHKKDLAAPGGDTALYLIEEFGPGG